MRKALSTTVTSCLALRRQTTRPTLLFPTTQLARRTDSLRILRSRVFTHDQARLRRIVPDVKRGSLSRHSTRASENFDQMRLESSTPGGLSAHLIDVKSTVVVARNTACWCWASVALILEKYFSNNMNRRGFPKSTPTSGKPSNR